jgi:hypothetical protein
VVYFRSGDRSTQAATMIAETGHSAVLDLGAMVDWEVD